MQKINREYISQSSQEHVSIPTKDFYLLFPQTIDVVISNKKQTAKTAIKFFLNSK
jgi:hypothetical protein